MPTKPGGEAWTSVDMSRPSSLDIRAKAWTDATLKLCTDESGVVSGREADRASRRLLPHKLWTGGYLSPCIEGGDTEHPA